MKKIFPLFLLISILINHSKAQLTTLGSGSTAGTNDWVFTLLNDPSTDLLYVGGKFTTVGNVYSPFAASWNGTSWSALGTGLNGPVRAFCKFQGSLYAAGEFTMAGSDTVNFIARWDGANWHKVGDGFNGTAITLCIYNNQLHAGGVFTQSGADVVRRLAKWNGSKWVEVGGGVNGPGSVYATSVFTLAVFQNQLYVGGNFTTANNGSVIFDGNFARWNGFSWQDLPNYQSNPQDLVTCLALDNNILWVGGVEGSFIITYDGINWLFGSDSPLPSFTVNDDVYDVEFYDAKAFVGGMFTAAGVSGGSGQFEDEFVQGIKDEEWQSLDGGVNNTVFCMEVYHDELYIGGAFTRLNTGSVQANYIARWKSPLEIVVTKSDVRCFGETNGSISLSPESGISPYSYTWDNSSSGNSRTNLAAGNYAYTVSDNSGRNITGTITIESPDELSVYLNTIASSGNNGVVQAIVSGGTPPYNYTWSGSSSTASFLNGLSPGNYSVTVSDSNSCTLTGSAIVDSLINSAVSAVSKADWTISPNPTEGIIMLENTGNLIGECTLVIYNQLGKIVSEERIFENKITLDITSLPKGIYLVGIFNNLMPARSYYNKIVLR